MGGLAGSTRCAHRTQRGNAGRRRRPVRRGENAGRRRRPARGGDRGHPVPVLARWGDGWAMMWTASWC